MRITLHFTKGTPRQDVIVRDASEAERKADEAGALGYRVYVEGGSELLVRLPGCGWVAMPQPTPRMEVAHDPR